MYIKYRSYKCDPSTETVQKVEFTDYGYNDGEYEKQYYVEDPYFETLMSVWESDCEVVEG